MEAVNIWQTLAQSGIAILVLGLGNYMFWRQIQRLLAKQEERIEELDGQFIGATEQKDALQKEFRDAMQLMQDKHVAMERQWMGALSENTEVLKDLKALIEKKF